MKMSQLIDAALEAAGPVPLGAIVILDADSGSPIYPIRQLYDALVDYGPVIYRGQQYSEHSTEYRIRVSSVPMADQIDVKGSNPA